MKTFEEKVSEALINQLVTGYRMTDQYGSIVEQKTPLQQIVARELDNNNKFIVEEVSKIMGSSDIKKAVSSYITESLSSEYKLASYQKLFLDYFKSVIEEEVVKDLKVLLKGKKITVTIDEE